MAQHESYPTGPQGATGPSSYGSAPGSSGGGAAPRSVSLAVKLILGAVALSVLSALVAFLTIDDQVTAQAEAQGVSADTVRAVVIGTILVVVVLTVVVFAVLALLINRGKNWARIVYTILGALSVLSLVTTFNGQVIVASLVVDVVQALLTVGAIVLLYRPDANAFFSRR